MQDRDKFLQEIRSDDAEVRFAAWRRAGEMDAAVIAGLGKLAASEKPGVAKAAREAISTLVHSVGKESGTPKRAEVVKALLELAEGAAPPLRAFALRWLSLLAGEDAVAAVARWINDPALREEVVYCLERIPGPAPLKALLAACKDAREDFKPRILAALGHRRAEEAVGLCLEAMRSPNKELALAAAKAFGRIGKKAAAAPRWPDAAGLSEWQKIERMDSLLRYADAQAAEGNAGEAMKIYRTALEAPEEHWQSAAIIGIARMGTAEAAAAIFPKLKSSDRTVRLTAAKAWQGMAKL
ncbi:MAG: HEAT repeat domain-containing protein [Acidobacteriota bacterium]